MGMILDIIPRDENSEYVVDVDITDDTLLCLDTGDIESQLPIGKRHINFYLDRKISYEEACEILNKLESISGNESVVSIFTSGCNFNDMMKSIGSRDTGVSYEMHIDDDKGIRDIIDVTNVICGLNFSRISCDCYFSDRYLMNFNAGEFDTLCNISECKFDREKMMKMRLGVEDVWEKLIHSCFYADLVGQLGKVELVLDYVDSDDASKYLEMFGDVSKSEAKVRLSNLLLDNYFAKVNSFVVEGKHLPSDSQCVWLVTTIDGANYGHGLSSDERFTNLEEKGYVDGVVRLDEKHKYRDDYLRSVDSYETLDYDDYYNLKSVLERKKKNFDQNGESDSVDNSSGICSMPPLLSEISGKPVISYIKQKLPTKMPLLFPNGRDKK